MTNADSRKPEYSLAPAPWLLTGKAFIVALRCDSDLLDNHSFLPDSLKSSRRGQLGYMMFVDYSSSDVGPYHELLFIPGSCRFADGRRHMSISRIFVSSMDSVINGQNNWGIPKDQAQFHVAYDKRGNAKIEVRYQDRFMAKLAFRPWPISVPVAGQLLPARFRTLGQYMDGKSYIYTPSASGKATLAKMTECEINGELFPDIGKQKVLACAHLKSFRMQFPVARVIDQQ